jgi:hypothetical protein
MTNAKILQLTNSAIGAVAANANLPLGVITVIHPFDTSNCFPTYTITSSTSDTLSVNKSGTYKVVYSLSGVAGAAGEVTIVMNVNGVSKYSVSATATADGTVNITLPYELYIPCNCATAPINVPAAIQFENTGVALTGGTSNLIVSKEI